MGQGFQIIVGLRAVWGVLAAAIHVGHETSSYRLGGGICKSRYVMSAAAALEVVAAMVAMVVAATAMMVVATAMVVVTSSSAEASRIDAGEFSRARATGQMVGSGWWR